MAEVTMRVVLEIKDGTAATVLDLQESYDGANGNLTAKIDAGLAAALGRVRDFLGIQAAP